MEGFLQAERNYQQEGTEAWKLPADRCWEGMVVGHLGIHLVEALRLEERAVHHLAVGPCRGEAWEAEMVGDQMVVVRRTGEVLRQKVEQNRVDVVARIRIPLEAAHLRSHRLQ